jgi:sulfotransferase
MTATDNHGVRIAGDAMQDTIHFISGLPRSGSTLLAAILRQNPRFHAAMSSPLGTMFSSMLGDMSHRNEFALFINETQKKAILRGLFENYYGEEFAGKIVFDTNRVWCSKMPALTTLFPHAKVIACARHVPWILDSIERLIRRNMFDMSKIFNFEPGSTVYHRVEGLSSPAGMVSFSWNALKEAYYGEQADRLMVLTYESLTREPQKAIDAVYDFIGQVPFKHDFEHLSYNEDEFDARLGTPGLHRVAAKVRYRERQTVLPPDLFHRFENDSFWTNPQLNQRGVRVV